VEPTSPYRPRLSRETRQLLTAGLLAIAALWLLARVRFRDLPVTPNPIPAVMSQLATRAKYEDLAEDIAQLQARAEPSLLALDRSSLAAVSPQALHGIAALRFRDDAAVTLLPGSGFDEANLLGRDRASGLAVVRVPQQAHILPEPWIPRRLEAPRYLMAADVSPKGVAFHPVFVGSLDAVQTPLWAEALWTVPASSDLAPGSFVFTSNAELAGLVIPYAGERAIVPAATLFAEANHLLEQPKAPAGAVGIEVQELTAAVASATGASGGVIVTWVDPAGAAVDRLMAGDVIEALDGHPLQTRQQWDVRAARLSAGDTLNLGVRSHGQIRDVALVATAPTVQAPNRSLGLTLRRRPGIGADVIAVQRASVADRAGLKTGDVITLVGNVHAPAPVQVVQSFASIGEGQRVIVVVTRGETHFVTTLVR
jgi:hypothetical protein